MTLPDFITSYWKSAPSGELLVGGLSVSSLVARHGTPVFVYDHAIVQRKYAVLRAALPQRFAISYSVKANPHPRFLKFFVDQGCGLEIASAGELFQSQSAGCPAEKIIFAGPGKTEAELALALEQGIAEIHAESELEIDRISALGRKLDLSARIALRVNPSDEGEGGAMRMGGRSAPFGVDEEHLEPLLKRIASDPHLDFRGVHLFLGTQILDHQVVLDQYRKGLEVGRFVARVLDCSLSTFDFGGGLGIPYQLDDRELDLRQLHDGLSELMARIEDEDCFEHTKFMVEPGRFLAGDSGIYVARVNDIKTSRGKKYLILDGGMNHHLAASGNLGQVIKRNFPLALLNKFNAIESENVEVVGPLCTPLDTLGRGVQLPKAEVGDLLGIFQSGAYARSASPMGFLSHATPPEVWVEYGQDHLIRRRGNVADYLVDVQPTDPVIEACR